MKKLQINITKAQITSFSVILAIVVKHCQSHQKLLEETNANI